MHVLARRCVSISHAEPHRRSTRRLKGAQRRGFALQNLRKLSAISSTLRMCYWRAETQAEGWSSTGRESSHLLALQLLQSPFIPGHPGQHSMSGPPPLPCLRHNVVNTRSPGQRAPPPGLRRTSRQVMNGLTMPSSFSHAGTRTRAPQRRRFNTPGKSNGQQNQWPSIREKERRSRFPGPTKEVPDRATQPIFPG